MPIPSRLPVPESPEDKTSRDVESRHRKLRVHFITEDDPLYVSRFFETFFEQYPTEEIELVGITIQEPFNESSVATARRVLSLYGITGFLRLLSRVVRRKLRGLSVEALASKHDIPLVPAKSVNSPDAVRRVAALRPDVVVSVAAPEIFRDDLLRAPRLGCINIHSGRLPRYRGMMPTFWQMRFGEQHAVVTVHEMVAELDSGGILGTAECQIAPHDSLDRVITITKIEGAHLMIRVLCDLAAGTARARPLDMTDASYYSFPRRSDVKEFRRRGHRVL